MKTKGIKALTLISGLFLGNSLNAQKSNGTVTETFKVAGNCGMCKKTIETATKVKGVKSAEWNETNKVLTVKYDKGKTNADQVLRNVAYAGYDNERFLAPDAAYNKLHGCCQYERVDRPMTAAAKHIDHQPGSIKEIETKPAQVRESGINAVYNQYFAIKDALVKSDPSASSAAANELLTSIAKVDMGALKEKEHEDYMKSVNKVKEYSQAIAQNKNLENQRMAFSKLSEFMYDLMKVIHPGYEVHLDHCPMYNDGKGANWLSKEEAIRNPYYGSKMMTCGNVSETLK
jgi:copper chaperone CopZ